MVPNVRGHTSYVVQIGAAPFYCASADMDQAAPKTNPNLNLHHMNSGNTSQLCLVG